MLVGATRASTQKIGKLSRKSARQVAQCSGNLDTQKERVVLDIINPSAIAGRSQAAGVQGGADGAFPLPQGHRPRLGEEVDRVQKKTLAALMNIASSARRGAASRPTAPECDVHDGCGLGGDQGVPRRTSIGASSSQPPVGLRLHSRVLERHTSWNQLRSPTMCTPTHN